MLAPYRSDRYRSEKCLPYHDARVPATLSRRAFHSFFGIPILINNSVENAAVAYCMSGADSLEELYKVVRAGATMERFIPQAESIAMPFSVDTMIKLAAAMKSAESFQAQPYSGTHNYPT